MNITYINILIDTLRKKNEVLKELLALTEKQSTLLAKESFNADEFEAAINGKAKLLERLNSLDVGFDEVFGHVREVLQTEKELYKEQILELQKLIRTATELGVKLQTTEEHNKNKLQLHMSESRQKMKDFKVSSKTAAAYYKNMTNRHQDGQSYFMDKKK